MAPDLERLARTPWPIACCASSGTRLFQFSLGALVFEKCRVGSSKRAGEFRPGIGGAHIDSCGPPAMRGFGGSTPNRVGGSPFSTHRQNFRSAVTMRC